MRNQAVFAVWVTFWHIPITNLNQLFTAMIATYLSQKNICAVLGLLMAFTIVWKAKTEASSYTQDHTARFETTKPTKSIGQSEGVYHLNQKTIKPEISSEMLELRPVKS